MNVILLLYGLALLCLGAGIAIARRRAQRRIALGLTLVFFALGLLFFRHLFTPLNWVDTISVVASLVLATAGAIVLLTDF